MDFPQRCCRGSRLLHVQNDKRKNYKVWHHSRWDWTKALVWYRHLQRIESEVTKTNNKLAAISPPEFWTGQENSIILYRNLQGEDLRDWEQWYHM